MPDTVSAPPSFRQPSTSVTNITNSSNNNISGSSSTTSYSLDYAVNNRKNNDNNNNSSVMASTIDDFAASTATMKLNSSSENIRFSASHNLDRGCSSSLSSSSFSSLNRSAVLKSSSSQQSAGSNVSLTHITQDSQIQTGVPHASSVAFAPTNTNVNRVPSFGLYSKASNISTHFGKGSCSSSSRDDVRYLHHGLSTRVGGGIPRSLSLNLKTPLEAVPGSPGSTPQSPESASISNKSNFELESSPRTPESPFRLSGGSALQSPNSQCSSILSSPLTNLHSPTTALSKLNFNSTIDNHKTYSSVTSRSSSSSASQNKSILSSNSKQETKSPTIIEVRKSPTVMENIFETQYSTVEFNKNESHDTSNNNNNNNSNNNQNYYSSTATISVVAGNNNNNNNDNNNLDLPTEAGSGHPRSVCIIEVNTETPVTYVENCTSEPMVVRETEIIATPCTDADIINHVNNNISKYSSNSNNNSRSSDNINSSSCDVDGRNVNNEHNVHSGISKEHLDHSSRIDRPHKTLVPIWASASFGNIVDRPKVLELCAPIYNAKRQLSSGNGSGALVVGDSTWQTRNPEAADDGSSSNSMLHHPCHPVSGIPTNSESTQTSPIPYRTLEKSNNLGIIYDSEGTSVADSSDYNDTTSEFSVMQSDSGISFQTDSDSNMPHPIPRCYSSSETHLNTRRLLESNAAGGDYSTRKSCSNDEVAKNWSSLHKPLGSNNSHPLPISRDSSNNNNSFGGGPMNNSNWNYPGGGELVRCDSWSTSGLGSELSDWESLQEDANSTHYDDTTGPFDAVFSDVFPGDKSDAMGSPHAYHHVFPQLFRETHERKMMMDVNLDHNEMGAADSKKPRHHSFKDQQQRWRLQQQQKQIPLARPASLPGVMGSYLALMQVRAARDTILKYI